MAKKQIDKKFESIVQFAELERFIDQKLKNYSSGMQVRLAFSVSIHANREILLMDEPCSALDPIATGKIEELMLALKKIYTIIISTSQLLQQPWMYCKAYRTYEGWRLSCHLQMQNVKQ